MAALIAAASVTAFGGTAISAKAASSYETDFTEQTAAPVITGFGAELTDNGTALSWDPINGKSYLFLFRQTAQSLDLAALLDAENTSYLDTAAPVGETCTYFIQTDITVNGITSLCVSDKVSVSANTPESNSLNANLTIGSGKATVNWNKIAASGYIITMDGKNIHDTKSADVTSYTVSGLNNYEKHVFTIKSYTSENGEITFGEESEALSTTSYDTILNSARTSDTRSFNVFNKQGSTTKTYAKELSDYDISVLEKFAAEHFTDDMTDTQKLETTYLWIHRNVQYASSSANWSKISGKSYADAIFTYKTGQCAQYNGAMVSMMRYLGYEANLIQGWRGNRYSYWQHYWCEVEIDGLKYLVETGNLGKNGNWKYFLTPYSKADGKFFTNS